MEKKEFILFTQIKNRNQNSLLFELYFVDYQYLLNFQKKHFLSLIIIILSHIQLELI